MVAYTTTYSLAKPTVGDDEDVWGGYLNGNFDTIESLLKGTTSLTSLSLTGNITVSGTVDGRDIATDGTKLDGIEASADVTDTANVTAAGALMTTGGTLTGALNFGDNVKAQFGTGSDLEIYHDGSNSYIFDGGTGNLSLTSDGAKVSLAKHAPFEFMVEAITDGAVNLYYDGSKKLATTSTGIDVTGTVVADGAQIDLSGARQLNAQIATSGSGYGAITCVEPSASNLRGLELEGQLLRFGTNAYNQTTSVRRMQINDAGEAIFYEDTGADAKMRWNPTSEQLKFEDNVKATFGASDDLQIYHDGSQSVIKDVGTGQLLLQGSNTIALTTSAGANLLRLVTGGAVTAYHNGSEKLATTSTGIDVTGKINCDDEIQIEASTGYGRIEVGGPDGAFLDLKSPHSDDYDGRLVTTGSGLDIQSSTGTSIRLNHGGSTKLETTSTGINVTGTAQADLFLADTGGGLLRRYQSTWSYPTHDVIHSGYLSAIGDYVYLKAAGNSGDNHGQLIVADNGIYFGKTDAETGAATNSATAPFDNTTYGYINSTGLTVSGDIQVNGENLYVGGNSGEAKIHLNATDYGSPQIELSDTDNDNFWTVAADDSDNNFKIQGSTSSIPNAKIDSPNFEIAQGGELRNNGNLIWTAGNDGSGSGLDADTVDGIQASSFLRSDANDSISNPFNLDFSTSNTSNYIPADNTTALAVAPFSALAWHDVFAFNRYYSATQEEWNGSAWSSTTLDDELFAQKENQSITVASGTTITKVRWNFTGTSWIQPQWLAIGFTYVAGGASKTVTVESSSDGGSTWTTRHSSTTTANGKVVHFKLSDWSGDANVRITIDRNDTNALKMSYMSLLTARSGDQGKGKEAQLPFGWDADKNLSMEGNLLFGDNEKAYFGDSNDLAIYHNGTASFIDDTGTGSLNLRGTNLNLQNAAGEAYISCVSDSHVYLYHDNTWKLRTDSAGIRVAGVVDAESLQEDYDALSGTTPSIDADNGGAFSLTMTGNTTFTFASVTSGRSVGFVLELTGNGGTVTWPASVDWAGGTAPDAPASGEKDILVFWTRDGGTTWHGVLSIDAAA